MINVIGMVANVGCMMIAIALGGIFLVIGLTEKESQGIVLGLALIVIGLAAVVKNRFDNSQYIPAEPIAYNSTQTVFATDKGNIIVNGVYPDGVYMLDMDGDTVLVVWQAVEGEEVGLG